MVPVAQKAALRSTDGRSLVVRKAISTMTSEMPARKGTEVSRKVLTGLEFGMFSVGRSMDQSVSAGIAAAASGEIDAICSRATSATGLRSTVWGTSLSPRKERWVSPRELMTRPVMRPSLSTASAAASICSSVTGVPSGSADEIAPAMLAATCAFTFSLSRSSWATVADRFSSKIVLRAR